jgi:hypothetical protein
VSKAEGNRELVRRMTLGFLRGDIEDVVRCWSDDIVWHFPGRTRHAGSFRGKEAVLAHLRDSGGADREELRPTAYLAGDDHAAVRYEVESVRGGRTLTESRILFCRIDGDLIREAWIYAFDLYALDEFWG